MQFHIDADLISVKRIYPLTIWSKFVNSKFRTTYITKKHPSGKSLYLYRDNTFLRQTACSSVRLLWTGRVDKTVQNSPGHWTSWVIIAVGIPQATALGYLQLNKCELYSQSAVPSALSIYIIPSYLSLPSPLLLLIFILDSASSSVTRSHLHWPASYWFSSKGVCSTTSILFSFNVHTCHLSHRCGWVDNWCM